MSLYLLLLISYFLSLLLLTPTNLLVVDEGAYEYAFIQI